MRKLLLVVAVAVLGAAPAHANRESCLTRCGDRFSSCSEHCSDERCLRRCGDALPPCQARCSAPGAKQAQQCADPATGEAVNCQKVKPPPTRGGGPPARPRR